MSLGCRFSGLGVNVRGSVAAHAIRHLWDRARRCRGLRIRRHLHGVEHKILFACDLELGG